MGSTLFHSSLKAIQGSQVTLSLKIVHPDVESVDANESLALVALYELAPPESTLRRELSWESILDAEWAKHHVLGIVTACHWEGKTREGLLHLTLSDPAWAEGLRVKAKADSATFVVTWDALPIAPLLPTRTQSGTRSLGPEDSIWMPRDLLLDYKSYTDWALVPPVLRMPAFAPEAYTPLADSTTSPEALRFQPVWAIDSRDHEQEFGVLWHVDADSFRVLSVSGNSTSMRTFSRDTWLLQPAVLKASSHAHRLSFDDYLRHANPHLLLAELKGHEVTLTLAQNQEFEPPHEGNALAHLLAVNATTEDAFDFKSQPGPLTDAINTLLRQHLLTWESGLDLAVSYGAHAWISGLSYEDEAPNLSLEALLALPEDQRLARWREIQHRQTLRFQLSSPDLAAHLPTLPLPRIRNYISELAYPLPPQPAPASAGTPDAFAFFWFLKGKTQRAMKDLETHHGRALARYGSTVSDQRLKRAGYENQVPAECETFATEAEAQAAFDARYAELLDAGYHQAPSTEECASYLREHLGLDLGPELTIQACLNPEHAATFPVGAILKDVSGAVLRVDALSSLEELYSLVRVSEGTLYLTLYLPDSYSVKLSPLQLAPPEPLPKPKKRKAK